MASFKMLTQGPAIYIFTLLSSVPPVGSLDKDFNKQLPPPAEYNEPTNAPLYNKTLIENVIH
jgi:hypothetical protein